MMASVALFGNKVKSSTTSRILSLLDKLNNETFDESFAMLSMPISTYLGCFGANDNGEETNLPITVSIRLLCSCF